MISPLESIVRMPSIQAIAAVELPIITYFISVTLLENQCIIGAIFNAIRLTYGVIRAKHTFLRHFAVCRRHYCTERTDENAGKTANAFLLINDDHTVVRFEKSAGYTALNADSASTMATVYGKMNSSAVLAFYPYSRHDAVRFTLKFEHLIQAGVGEYTFVFAKMTAEAPFFVYIYSFHSPA